MKGNYPFNSQFVDEKVHSCPNPIVEFVETVETKSGKYIRKSEVVRQLPADEYNATHPLPKQSFKLQDLLDAGVSLNEVPTAIYEDDLTQSELLSIVEDALPKKENEE